MYKKDVSNGVIFEPTVKACLEAIKQDARKKKALPKLKQILIGEDTLDTNTMMVAESPKKVAAKRIYEALDSWFHYKFSGTYKWWRYY